MNRTFAIAGSRARRPAEVRRARRLVRLLRARQAECENVCMVAVLIPLCISLGVWVLTLLAPLLSKAE